MGAPKSAVTKATAKIRDEAQALDDRRQKQIANQIEIVDRLMRENESLKAEISLLRADQSGA